MRKLRPVGTVEDDQASVRPSIDLWLARRILAGWTPRAIVVAAGGRTELSERTVYRWRAELVALADLELGGFRATFAIRRSLPPSRLTRWVRAGRPQAAQDGPGRPLVVPVGIRATAADPDVLAAIP